MHHEERQRQRLRIRLGLDKRVLHDFPAPVWVDAQDLVVREIRVSAEADRVVARFDIMGVDSLSLHPNSVTFLRFSTLASDFPAKIHTKSVNTIGDFTEGRELDHIDDWLPLHCLG